MSEREERVARNEAVSREINEGIEESLRPKQGHVRMLCECGRLECQELVAITIPEYEEVRRDARRFVVARGHVIPDVEEVVEETDRFVVVQKREGIPAEVAREENPRS